MRFSIREMLALALVAALAMVAWRADNEVKAKQITLEQLASEVDTKEASLLVKSPELHKSMLIVLDEADQMRKARETCEQHVETLIKKYGKIEPAGRDIVSMRTLPTIRLHGSDIPVVFRVWVPEDRKVWIKYGVHETKSGIQSARGGEQEGDLLDESPFDDSGPFAYELAPGEHLVRVGVGSSVDGLLPVKLQLDDQLLLETAFRSPHVTGAGSMHVSGKQQIDYGPDRKLPNLFTGNMSLQDESGNRPPKSFGFSIWLSENDGNFKEFPMQ